MKWATRDIIVILVIFGLGWYCGAHFAEFRAFVSHK